MNADQLKLIRISTLVNNLISECDTLKTGDQFFQGWDEGQMALALQVQEILDD